MSGATAIVVCYRCGSDDLTPRRRWCRPCGWRDQVPGPELERPKLKGKKVTLTVTLDATKILNDIQKRMLRRLNGEEEDE